MAKLSIATLTLFASLSSWAIPICDFSLSLTNATVGPGEMTQVLPQSFSVRRERSSENCSRYRMYFSKGLMNSYQRRAFNEYLQGYNYNLHQNINMNGILKELNDALNSSEFVQGSTPIRSTDYTNSFFISVPGFSTQTNHRAGTYRDYVTVSLYRLEQDNGVEFELNKTFQVNIDIPTELHVSLVNEGDPFNINATSKVMDFGNLELNQELRADIIINSNTPYQVRVSSLNNGRMMNGTTAVKYSLAINNSPVSLDASSTQPVAIANGSGPTTVAGQRYNARVRITDIPTGAKTGVYEDSITITAIAN